MVKRKRLRDCWWSKTINGDIGGVVGTQPVIQQMPCANRRIWRRDVQLHHLRPMNDLMWRRREARNVGLCFGQETLTFPQQLKQNGN